MKNKTLCFDIDGVICKTKKSDYKNSKPIKSAIKTINRLSEKNKIILFTARFMGRTNDNKTKATKLAKDMTIAQLKNWKVNYHKVFFGKPSYDLIIDDKSLDFKKNWFKNFFNNKIR